MKITREDVIRVADLAYLELSESELETPIGAFLTRKGVLFPYGP
jgi:Asp-tRNA(Asn)/Glu-tRNA(Gln) amidotransferase C subunit